MEKGHILYLKVCANEAVDPGNLRDLQVLLEEFLKINVASADISEIDFKIQGMCN